MDSIKMITREAANMENPECSSGSTASTAVQNPSGGRFAFPEIDFPKFRGENPRSWISHCETFFELVPVPEQKKVIAAALHMEAEGRNWYMYNSEELKAIPWSEFAEKVCKKFSPSKDEIMSRFRGLKQEGTVEEYMGKFEEIQYLMSCEFKCLDGDFFFSYFLTGLKDNIKHQVQMFSPKSVVEAFRLAKLQEKYCDGDDDDDEEEEEEH